MLPYMCCWGPVEGELSGAEEADVDEDMLL